MSKKVWLLIYTSILIILMFFIITILNINDSYENTVEYIKNRNLDEAKIISNQFKMYFKDRQNDLYSYSIMESNFNNTKNHLSNFSYDFSEFDLIIYSINDEYKLIHQGNSSIDSKLVMDSWNSYKDTSRNIHLHSENDIHCSKPTLIGNKIYGLIFCMPVSFKSQQEYLIGVVSLNRYADKYIYNKMRVNNSKPFAISYDGYKILSYDKDQVSKFYNDPSTLPTEDVVNNYYRMSQGEVFSGFHESHFTNGILNTNSHATKKILASYPVILDNDFKFSIGITTQISDIGFFNSKRNLQIFLTLILFPICASLVFYIIKLIINDNRLKIKAEETQKYTDELEKLNQKITEQNISLENTNKLLQEQDKIKTDYFANMSHELKMPLTVIISSTQLMEKHTTTENYSEKSQKWIKIIKQNAQRLSRLVNNLLTVIRLESKSVSLNKQNTEMFSFLSRLINQVTPFVEKRQLSIQFYSDCKRIILSIDRDKLEKVILNLLSNAIKFNKPNGSIIVTLNCDNDVVISVEDTGIGIPADKLNLIFERFVQLNHIYTREYEGSGIGLSLCKDLVQMHGGKISVESKVDIGTKFEIVLPSDSDSHSEDSGFCNSENDISIELSDVI